MKTTFVKNGYALSNEHFPIVSGNKISFKHNSLRKNLFFSKCLCWDSRCSLGELDQKYKLGGTFGSGDTYLQFLFCQFKLFRLHARLLDAAREKGAHSGKRIGYC